MTGGQLQALIRLICKAAGADGAATDVQYLQRFTTQHDQTAFAALVERHAPMVLGVCGRVLSDPNDVEDAFQATFLVLVRKARSIARPHLLANWLYGVAHRTALDAKTRRSRRQTRQRQAMDMPAPDATTALLWSDLRPVLDEELERLPERFRIPFVLCYLEGRTNDEAARLIGCPKGTVLSRLATARERLRIRLTKRGLAPSAALLATVLGSSALRAHAPLKLVRAAIEAALAYAGEVTVKATIAVEVVSLANGVIKTMLWTKLSHAAGVLLIVGAIGSAGVLAWGRTGNTSDGSEAQAEAKEIPKAQPSPKQDKKDQVDVKIVEVGQPLAMEISDQQEYIGRTEAVSTVEVRARVTGTLGKVHVKQGAEVKKGDLLFEIDAPSYVAELQKAQAILAQNAARLDRATAALDRVRNLLAKNVASQDEFKQAVGDVAEAKAGVAIAEGSIRIGRLNMEFTLVRAPGGGVIGRLPLGTSSLVKANETLLATIVTRDPMGLGFDIDDMTALRLRRALAAGKFKELASIPVAMGLGDETGFPRIGKIDSTDSALDPATRSLRVRAVFPNTDGLMLPGMFCHVRLTLEEPHQVLRIPLRAVITDQGQHFVFVVNSKDLIERRQIKGSKMVMVNIFLVTTTNSLNRDDWVILDGRDASKGYRPGMTVQPRKVSIEEQIRAKAP